LFDDFLAIEFFARSLILLARFNFRLGWLSLLQLLIFLSVASQEPIFVQNGAMGVEFRTSEVFKNVIID
jgi:hypothetical protein